MKSVIQWQFRYPIKLLLTKNCSMIREKTTNQRPHGTCICSSDQQSSIDFKQLNKYLLYSISLQYWPSIKYFQFQLKLPSGFDQDYFHILTNLNKERNFFHGKFSVPSVFQSTEIKIMILWNFQKKLKLPQKMKWRVALG